ncbi:GIY-YIG nuclease family protein [Flavobacterium piscisymbiosum]|uniref:GIY-YIG nuclease family protein n=1 Tax=Flavobacterium piscisymbiosum TaxID=2893753 RepID=A0ABS8MI04_9FLAO|nr:GIY-YIG nuclease family protein [Flavobacterium sp. F-30]MCC9065126.1 GIY-YIG nuclease family protein [Flavobacterium sp. F-30]
MENIKELQRLADELFNGARIELKSDPNFWKERFRGKESCAGVYILRDQLDRIVYVGETRTIQHRVKDLLNTHNHSFRRTVFKEFILNNENYDFEIRNDYKKAKELIREYICNEFTYSYLEVLLGRKELEEYIILEKKSENLFNKIGNKKILIKT